MTKANIVKATDGKFLKLCQAVGEKYPEITTDDWYIDIMTAKLVDEKRRRDFQVFVLPNLYGDIITDEPPNSRARGHGGLWQHWQKICQCSKPSTALPPA